MSKKIIQFLPAIFWFLLSFYLLTLPGTRLPKITWFNKIQGDKLVHIGMFAVLVSLFLLPSKIKWPQSSFIKTALTVALTALGYGIAMEFVQENFIPNRSFDVWDMVADGVGSFIPVFYIWFLIKKDRKAG
ncbi:hypothetical protein BH10BAC3_BH10BAC3_15510 [soil metagenome]